MTRKLFLRTLMLLITAAVITSVPLARAQDDSASMTIKRFVICNAIEDREPVGITNNFVAGSEKAYAFLEATDISSDVEISFVWIYENSEVARITLPIRQGSRWRTNSSKKLAGRAGAWRVEIQDATATVLSSLEFTVE